MSGYVALPAPVTADPGFWRQGVENLNALRDQQAKQASADAYRQATDPATGQVDVPKFNALIARGPGAWNAGPAMQQQGQAAGAQAQAGQGQFNLARDQNSAINSAVTAALATNDDNQLHSVIVQQASRLVDAGLVPRDKMMGFLATLSNNPAQARQQLETLRVQTLPPEQKQQWLYGSQQTIPTPQGTYVTNVPPLRSGQGVTVPHGPAPGTTTVTSEPYDKDGIIPRDASGVPTRKPDGYTDVTKPVTAVPGVPQGAPPQITPAPGSAPAAAPPAGLPPGAPPPLPGQRLVGGRFVTPPAAPAPVPTPPPAPSQPPAAAPPPVSTSTTLRGPGSPATPPGAMPPAIKTPPQGQPELLAKDNEVRTQANLAMEDQQKRLIAGNSALEALKLADTGPSTGFFARAYAFLKAQGITTVERGQLSDTDYRQLLQKNLLRFAQSSSRTAGTDLGLETQIHSNANVDDMLAGANRHVLIQDLGILKRSIAQTQEMPTSGPAGSVVKHVGEFSANTAPEAFMWNHYTPEERAAVEAQYAKDGKTKQLHDSLELAVRRGAIPDPRKAAPAARPAVAAPPPNPLVPTN